MVKANLGVSIASKWVVQSALRDRGLHSITLNAGGVFRRWYLTYRKNLHRDKKQVVQSLGPKLQRFLKSEYEY